MKKNVKKGLLILLKGAVMEEVKKSEKTDPPICPVIIHQPKRPRKQKNTNSATFTVNSAIGIFFLSGLMQNQRGNKSNS